MNQKLLNNFRLRAIVLVAILCAGFTSTWAEDVTWSHEFVSPEAISNNSITVGGATWSVATTEGKGTPDISAGKAYSKYGLKFGSNGSNFYGSVTFSTNYFNSYNVKSVKVNILNNGSKAGTLTAQQGNTSIGSTTQTFGQTWTDLTVNTNSGSGGTLSFTYSVEQAFYIHSIEVVYTSGGSTPTPDPNLEESDFALTGAPVALSFDLYNNSNAQTVSFTTSSTGAVIVSGSQYVETSVSGNTITVTPVKSTPSPQTITVSQTADATYAAGSATFSVTIANSTPGDWVLTPISDLTEDDVFVIVGNNGSNFAMTNNNGENSAPKATAVTIEDDEITSDVTNNMKWNISVYNNGYTFYPNGTTETWLYCTNDNNGVRVGTVTNDRFTIDGGYLKHTSTSRYVGIYNSQDWRCYTSNSGNIANQTFSFYKYQDYNDPNVPSIAASDVNIAYDATGGSFNYTINNPVEGGAVSVGIVSGGAWLTSATESNGTVSFTCSANETNAARQARVEITYNYNNTETVTKQVLITQAAVPTTYTITFDAGDGTFVGNEDFPSTTNTVVAGTYTLPSVTPPEGYYFNGWLPYLNASPKTGEYEVFGNVNFTAKYTSVTAPACSIDLDRYDFGKVALNTSATKTFTVTTANLTGELRLHNGGSPEEGFTISPTTIPQGATSTEVTITFTPTSIRPYSFFLKATGGGVYAHDLTEIRGEGAQSYTVTFNPGNGTCATASMACFENEEMDLPVATPSADCQVDGWTFAGWATDSIATASTASLVPSRYAPTQNITLYAVYQLAGAGATTTFNFYDIAIANHWAIETVQPTVEISPITLNAMGGGSNGTYFHNNDTWRMYNGGSLYITSIGGPITSVTSNPNTTFTITNGSASQSFTDKTEFKSITVNYTTATFATAPEYITVATNPVNVSAAAEVGTIGISYSNLTISQASDFHIQYCDAEGNELSAGSEPDWVTVSVAAQDPQIGEGYVVSYNIGENTSSKARSAYFKVYALDKFANTIYSDLITITQDRPVEMLTYTLVPAITNIPNITYGKHYIIVNQENGKAMGGQNTNNRAAVDVTINDATVTFASNVGVAEFIIYGPDEYGLYTIYDEDNNGYLYAAGGNNDNYLKIKENVDGGSLGYWNISIDADTKGFIIKDNGNPNSTFIQFNSNENIFSCYANTSMGPVHLYEKVGEATLTESVTVTSVGYATFASDYALDFTDTGIEAYIAKADGTTGVTFTPVNKIPIGTGVLLHKEGGATVDVPVLAGAADNVTDNVFFRGYDDTIESVETSSSHYYHNYILNNGASGLGFYRANGKMVAKNRAYIRIQNDESTNVKGFIALPGFGDETAVEAVKAEAVDGVIFNLAGQRVNSTQKGIFIHGGKKVVVK